MSRSSNSTTSPTSAHSGSGRDKAFGDVGGPFHSRCQSKIDPICHRLLTMVRLGVGVDSTAIPRMAAKLLPCIVRPKYCYEDTNYREEPQPTIPEILHT